MPGEEYGGGGLCGYVVAHEDQSASRYVKVFYDRDTQDPLEGQLTKTGAGLVLKRKTDRLGELFIFKRKKNKTSNE